MSDPHDREPVDQATIECWRVNYGLDKRTPGEAARYWAEACAGMAPAGAVAALGVALDDMDELRKDAERYRWLRAQHWDTGILAVVADPKDAIKLGYDCPSLARLDEQIDAAMLAQRAVGAV